MHGDVFNEDQLDRYLWRHETGRYPAILLLRDFKQALESFEVHYQRLAVYRESLLHYALPAVRRLESFLRQAHHRLAISDFRGCLSVMRRSDSALSELRLCVRAIQDIESLHGDLAKFRAQIPLDDLESLPSVRGLLGTIEECWQYVSKSPQVTVQLVRLCRQQLQRWCEQSEFSLDFFQRLQRIKTLYGQSLEWPVNFSFDERVLNRAEALLVPKDGIVLSVLLAMVLNDCEQEIEVFQTFLHNWQNAQTYLKQENVISQSPISLRLTVQKIMQEHSVEQATMYLQQVALQQQVQSLKAQKTPRIQNDFHAFYDSAV